MNKPLAAAALACVALSSCTAGPSQLRRSVDDFDQKLYVESPLIDGALHFVGVIPLANFGASIGDFFIVNAYHFWGKDVWRNEGTYFTHWTPEEQGPRVNSLFAGGPFLEEVN